MKQHLRNPFLILFAGYYCYAYLFFNRLFFAVSDESRFHPVFIQVVIICAAVAIYFVSQRVPARIDFRPSARMCAGIFALCASAVVIDYFGIRLSTGFSLASQSLACLLFGTGFVLYTLVWARVYERLRLPFILATLAGALVVSTLIRVLTYAGDIYGRILPAVVLCVIIAVSLAAAYHLSGRMCSLGWEKDAECQKRLDNAHCMLKIVSSSAAARPLPFRALDSDLLSRIKAPLLAIACVGFGVGLSWGESAATQYNVGLSLVASVAVFCVAVFVACTQKDNLKGYATFYSVAFPLSTLLLLASLLVAGAQTHIVLGWLLSLSYYFALALFELCSLAALISIAQTNGVASAAAVLMKFIAYGTGMVLGKVALIGLGGASVEAILCFALVAYLAYTIFLLAGNQMEDARYSASSALESVGSSLGERFGLTSREREVLVCLLEGRTYEGTGRVLFVSASTVKTHVKHLYEKMGVKNRDELIELIFGNRKDRKE